MTTQWKNAGPYLWGSVLAAGILPLLLYWPSFVQPPSADSVLVRDIGTFEQWLVVTTAFGVKPAYMVLSLVWIVVLWRRRATDLVALRWGVIFFLGGEIACAANYLVFGGDSAVTDYLHSYGMAAGFSFIAYAVLEGMDIRLIKYTPAKDRCAALSLCRSCIKYAEVPCGLRRLFFFLIPALIVVSFMLPSADLKPLSHRTHILGSTQDFLSPTWAQLFESRYCAWLSISLLLLSWGALSFKRNDPVATAKLFFAAAMGPLGFGLMRLFLRTAYRENLAWANIWEELTELIFVASVGIVLWLFRGTLFREEPSASPDHMDAAKTRPVC
jgi:hypothetical protein